MPVNLYSATERQAEVRFRQIYKTDAAPIDYRRHCGAENVEVEWGDIAKGYEYEKGKFVVMTDADFDKARRQRPRSRGGAFDARRASDPRDVPDVSGPGGS